ncbi:hypothetical protein BCF33_0111 [Hasllibacter halocynthiae]|uniref:Uncharacterized protein n=1 Tax=Hasllibacter halocynthiae TaxID=595589 RepID=A0A2T0X6D8_9RHOB|nr:hypothetical protein [Hasllibacter halocynthiae]PRY94520.1 hypothetical protein BCF33_0111 [Hasllibacter halocynthiae]
MNRYVPITLCALLALPAAAQDVTDADRAAIDERIETLGDAATEWDIEGMTEVVPPEVFVYQAEQVGLEPDALKTMMAEALEGVAATVQIESFDMDLDAATEGATSTGRPYLLIPTETVMDIEGAGRVRAETHTLALEANDDWWLVRIDELPQVQALRAVYPDFAGVEFPGGTMEALE